MKNTRNVDAKRGFLAVTTLVLAVAMTFLVFTGMNRAADCLPDGISGVVITHDVDIEIEKPNAWQTKKADIRIIVRTLASVKKVEAKIGEKGNWQDITDDMSVEISENCTVYVQVTDNKGNMFEKNHYIECFDRTAPTVKAGVTKKAIQIDCQDDLSGVASVYIDGHSYSNLTADKLDLPVKEVTNGEYDTLTVYAVDKAGNRSATLELKNPLYQSKDDSEKKTLNERPSTTEEKQDGKGETTDNTSGSATGTDNTKSSSQITSSGNNASQNSSTNQTTNNTSSTASNSTQSSDTPSNNVDTSTSNAHQNTSSNTVNQNDNRQSNNSTSNNENPLFGTFVDTNKQFMSIVTKEGEVFYLIVDHDKSSENVYFLTEISNDDLKSVTGDDENTDGSGFIDEKSTDDSSSKDSEKDKPSLDDDFNNDGEKTDTDGITSEETGEIDKAQKSSPVFFIILAVLAVAGAGYYFKIYKPKKELENADDLDDYNFIEEGEKPELPALDEDIYSDNEDDSQDINESETIDEDNQEEEADFYYMGDDFDSSDDEE